VTLQRIPVLPGKPAAPTSCSTLINRKKLTSRLCKVWRYLCLPMVLLTLCLQTAAATETSESATGSDERGSYEGAIETEYPDWFKTSFLELEEDVLEAREAGKRLMLVFHQDGCPYCNALIERNLAQKDIEQTIRDNFDVIEINIWGDLEVTDMDGAQFTEKSFARQLKVQFTPTILFYDEAGQFALRLNGYYPPDKFRVALDYVVGRHDKKQTFNDYLAEHHRPVGETSTTEARPYITGGAADLGRLAREDKPLLLLFEQSDCSNCRRLNDEVFSLDETAEYLSGFNVVRLNMWGKGQTTGPDNQETTERELAKSLGVMYAPTLVFYASEGTDKQEVIRSESWFKRFHTQSMMDYVLSDQWKEESNFQRYISARAETMREAGVDVNIYD
jgi:thioredoxin-related protein